MKLQILRFAFFGAITVSTVLTLERCATTRSEGGQSHSDTKYTTRQQLGDIYYMALENSYEYMFDDASSIQLYGQTVGRFTGGMKGLFLYSGLKDALITYSEGQISEMTDFYDLTPYYQWAGERNLFKGGERVFYAWDRPQTEPFHQYNSAIVKWGYENLIPDPKIKIGDKTAKEVYDAVLQRYCRLMVESRNYLEQAGLQAEVENYSKQMDRPQFEAIDYFDNRYGGKLPAYEEGLRYSALRPSMAISFWMRRKMDGSEEAFRIGFDKIMRLYDAQWYKGKELVK